MAAEHLGLEAVGETLVALGAGDELGAVPGQGRAAMAARYQLAGDQNGGSSRAASSGRPQSPNSVTNRGRPSPAQRRALASSSASQAACSRPVPVGGQHRGGEHPVGVGLDPVVLDQGPRRVGVADGAATRRANPS